MKKKLLAILLLLCITLCSCSSISGKLNNGSFSETTLEKEKNVEPNVSLEYKKISFLGAGDNIVYKGTWMDAKQFGAQTGRTYNFQPMYSEVAELIKNADVSFINQETVMAGEDYALSAYPNFNSPRDLGYDICELGFDVVNIANNHMLDKGSQGLQNTIDFWNTLPITMIGGYDNEADYNNVVIHEKEGIKIALLSYTEMTNGILPSKKFETHIPYLNEANIEEEVAKAKSVSDVVVVSVHWGTEGAFAPNNYQKNYAKKFADAGVDVVIGHHPHVLQPIEWIEGNNGNKMLCVYSLGNFNAEQEFDYNMVGGMITFDIVKVGDSRPKIENVIMIPTVFDHDIGTWRNNKVYLLENYTEAQANSHGVASYGHRTSLAKLQGFVKKAISDEFLSDNYKNSLKK